MQNKLDINGLLKLDFLFNISFPAAGTSGNPEQVIAKMFDTILHKDQLSYKKKQTNKTQVLQLKCKLHEYRKTEIKSY